MSLKDKCRHIFAELGGHIPFTILGAGLGIFFMLVFRRLGAGSGRTLFVVFHPGHVVLSAMVTASMFRLHAAKRNFVLVLLVGYFGSIGIATLSDIIIPHIGTHLLRLDIPAHGELHEHAGSDSEAAGGPEHGEAAPDSGGGHHESGIHLAFIEEWYIVNPAALFGVLVAFFLPHTKFPHAGHILISTWASSAYLLMRVQSEVSIAAAVGMFATLFIAVWVPCCISDIVFPLLFVEPDLRLAAACSHHWLHSHAHLHKAEEDCQ